jgi:hypothetical protein
MTYVIKEPQIPGVVDVHNDHIFSDVKKGKTHGEIHTGSGQFPNRDLHGRQVLITDSEYIYFYIVKRKRVEYYDY